MQAATTLNTPRHPLLALPQMLSLIQFQLLSWPAGLNSASSESPFSKRSSDSTSQLPPALTTALLRESQKRTTDFLRGITHYLYSPYSGPQPQESHTILESDGCRLRWYHSTLSEAANRPIIFCIPSLINRYTVLDLTPETSFVNYLNESGFDCLIVEWHTPSDNQATETMADYVMKLIYTLQEHWDSINRPLVAVGYCMGGVLATALAQLFPRIVGLSLLATPWDYGAYPCAGLSLNAVERLKSLIRKSPLLQPEQLQALLYLANPYRLYQRYSEFSKMHDEEKRAQFVAVEHWANEGVAIPRAVAEECLIQWPQNNALLAHEWQVEGEVIAPSTLAIPSFVALPQHDQIVPTASAYPLAEQLTNPTIVRPSSGHVGMLVGRKRHELLSPFGAWLLRHFA